MHESETAQSAYLQLVQVNGVLPLGVKQLEAGREFFLLLFCKLETPFGFSHGHPAAAAARSSQHT
jgi:hypothetical protein